jgi:hypothetical protein
MSRDIFSDMIQIVQEMNIHCTVTKGIGKIIARDSMISIIGSDSLSRNLEANALCCRRFKAASEFPITRSSYDLERRAAFSPFVSDIEL